MTEPLPALRQYRQRVVDFVISQVGVTKSEGLQEYWTGAGLDGTARDLAWCGLFALAALHAAGLALDRNWKFGRGFLLEKPPLPIVKVPKPGDILYMDQPYQHHGVVVLVTPIMSGIANVHSVDGNLRDENGISRVRRVNRAMSAKDIVFFSIEPLIQEALTR